MKKTKTKNNESEILAMFQIAHNRIGEYCKVYLTNLKSGKGKTISYGRESYCYGKILDVKLCKKGDIVKGITYLVEPLETEVDERLIKKRIATGVEFTKEPTPIYRECTKLRTPIDWSVINDLATRAYDETVGTREVA